jgi:nicotinate-nucleotide adenylyltransferase
MALRVGLFGGTFDPPHIGHLILAAEAQSQLGLDRLFWILTPNPPHKKNQLITPLKDRLAMVRLALADSPAFELSTIDIDRPDPQYALDTVKIVANLYPEATLFYLMGGDSLRDLPKWHLPADFISRLDGIGVMRRPGDLIGLSDLEKQIPGLTAKVYFVDAPRLDISAHEIRTRATEGRPYRYFLPTKVYNYIVKHNLFQSV